jgi:hypothetical protein
MEGVRRVHLLAANAKPQPARRVFTRIKKDAGRRSRFREGQGVMLYKIARLLQLAGLVILPIAIAGNIAQRDEKPVLTLGQSLGLSAIGVLVFSLGWLLQQGSRPK